MPERARLPVADRGLIIKFLTIALWSVLFVVFLPEAYRGVIALGIVLLLTLSTVIGTTLAVVGLRHRDNLVLEVAGLWMMLAGPVGYVILVTVVGIAQVVQTGITDRIAVIALGLLAVEVVATRLAFLLDRRRAVKADSVPEAGAR